MCNASNFLFINVLFFDNILKTRNDLNIFFCDFHFYLFVWRKFDHFWHQTSYFWCFFDCCTNFADCCFVFVYNYIVLQNCFFYFVDVQRFFNVHEFDWNHCEMKILNSSRNIFFHHNFEYVLFWNSSTSCKIFSKCFWFALLWC